MTVKNSGRAGCSGCDARATPFFDPEGPADGREAHLLRVRHPPPVPSGHSTRQVRIPAILASSRLAVARCICLAPGFFVFERMVLSHEHVGCLKLIRREVGSHWNRGKDRCSHAWHMDCGCPSRAFHRLHSLEFSHVSFTHDSPMVWSPFNPCSRYRDFDAGRGGCSKTG